MYLQIIRDETFIGDMTKKLGDFYNLQICHMNLSTHCADFYSEEPRTFYSKRPSRQMKIRNLETSGDEVQVKNRTVYMTCLEMSEALCYVAKDIVNLPPLSMNNFYLSKIIRDVETCVLIGDGRKNQMRQNYC